MTTQKIGSIMNVGVKPTFIIEPLLFNLKTKNAFCRGKKLHQIPFHYYLLHPKISSAEGEKSEE